MNACNTVAYFYAQCCTWEDDNNGDNDDDGDYGDILTCLILCSIAPKATFQSQQSQRERGAELYNPYWK